MSTQAHTLPDLSQVYNESADIDAEIRKFESFLEEAPTLHREEMEKRINSMPAPDDLETIQREKKFMAELRHKNVVGNHARSKTTNTFLLVLLTMATISVLIWIYQAIQSYGVLN